MATDFTQYHISIARTALVHLGYSIADSREPGADRDVDQLAEVIAREMRRAEATSMAKAEAEIARLSAMHHDLIVTMQAAIIEAEHGGGPEAALDWISNTLMGPGLLPDEDEPWGKDAQRYFSANKSDPFPVCVCGTPSNILWMGKGFCCDAHWKAAKAELLAENASNNCGGG